MKIIRPIKCVLTAAAVCILCFSGNGVYLYEVYAMAPENDIVELPQQPDEPLDKNVRKDERLHRIVNIRKKSLCSLFALAHIIHSRDNMPLFQHTPDDPIQSLSDTENVAVHELFAAKLPGNRSP